MTCSVFLEWCCSSHLKAQPSCSPFTQLPLEAERGHCSLCQKHLRSCSCIELRTVQGTFFHSGVSSLFVTDVWALFEVCWTLQRGQRHEGRRGEILHVSSVRTPSPRLTAGGQRGKALLFLCTEVFCIVSLFVSV